MHGIKYKMIFLFKYFFIDTYGLLNKKEESCN